jgi:hypothetical protein
MRAAGLRHIVLALILGAPLAAQAADPPEQLPPGLLPLLARPDHRTALLQAAQAVNAVQPGACPKANYVTTGEVSMLLPLRLDAKGQPVGGVWKESMNETGCDRTRVLNALTIVMPNGTLKTRPLLPGSTITDPQLQQDSVQYAAAGMGEMPAGCDQGGVVDTAFVGVDGEPAGTKPPAGGVLKPWTELWTLQACNRRAQVTMHFTPGPSGTEIQATPFAPP